MKKYYIILKSINGDLLRVYGVNTKGEVNKEVTLYMMCGYQVTVTCASVLQTAQNLEKERKMADIHSII